jgi:predicted dehydrogenase
MFGKHKIFEIYVEKRMKQFSVAIAGLGARGYDTYAKFQFIEPLRMKVVAVAEPDADKRNRAAKEFGIKADMCFTDAEEMLARGRLADCIFITTQDRQHLAHLLGALDAGYDILLEKPISVKMSDCLDIMKKVQEKNKLVVVCHVLRYTVFYKTIKKLLDEGKIGKLATIQAIENVGYWHYAHSFVRGNWCKKEDSSPMILQKCSHDFDIIAWLIGEKCNTLNSYGSLKFFKDDKAPADSTKFCVDCPRKGACPYDAYAIYVDSELTGVKHGNTGWPCNIITPNPTEKSVREALETSRYGRCVFRCDNDVVDHQIVSMQFDGDITAVLTMSGLTARVTREIKLMGSEGEIVGDQGTNKIVLTRFGEQSVEYDITKMTDDLSGHGGGDNEMLKQFFDSLEAGKHNASSTIENSILSHAMAFAAEESRLKNGKAINISEYLK